MPNSKSSKFLSLPRGYSSEGELKEWEIRLLKSLECDDENSKFWLRFLDRMVALGSKSKLGPYCCQKVVLQILDLSLEGIECEEMIGEW